MRYIPLSAHERGYVGSQWNAKFLRAVQCMLIPTQGKGVGSVSFFEADFGKNSLEFVRFLCMPDKLIAARGNFSARGRGRKDETSQDLLKRKAKWKDNQKRINEWNRLFDLLGDETDEFIEKIGDNEFLPEKVLGLRTDLQKKLYLHYLTIPRILALLGKLEVGSPTKKVILSYLSEEFPLMYHDLVTLIAYSENQQQYMFKNFTACFGNSGVADILSVLEKTDFDADKQFATWSKIKKKALFTKTDFELLRVYRRFVVLNILNGEDHNDAQKLILEQNKCKLGAILQKYMGEFEKIVLKYAESEKATAFIQKTTDVIFNSIQLKLFDLELERV